MSIYREQFVVILLIVVNLNNIANHSRTNIANLLHPLLAN